MTLVGGLNDDMGVSEIPRRLRGSG